MRINFPIPLSHPTERMERYITPAAHARYNITRIACTEVHTPSPGVTSHSATAIIDTLVTATTTTFYYSDDDDDDDEQMRARVCRSPGTCTRIENAKF